MLREIIKPAPGGHQPPQQPSIPPQATHPYGAQTAAYPTQPSYNSPAPAANPSYATSMSKNILSSDVEIKGSLKFSNDLIIDGQIEGEVISDGNLTVGENAVIKGEIRTRSVTLFGNVVGNITVSDRCELKSNAVLEGDITAGKLSIEEGASFSGKSSVGKPSSKPAAAAAAKPATAPGV